MRKLRVAIAAVLILVVLASAGIAWAALTYKTIPFDFVVTTSGPPPGTPSIEAYSDSGATQVITALHFGEVRQWTIYVKNIGTATGNVTIALAETYSWGTMSFTPSTFSLAPNAVQGVAIALTPNAGLPAAIYSGNMTIGD